MFFKIQSLCDDLTSSKVTERKKAFNNFLQVVQTCEAIRVLNLNGKERWDLVINSVHKYLLKESEKAHEDKKKKGTSNQLNGSLFHEIVKLTVSEGRNYNVETIVKCIKECLENDTLNEYCLIHYLNTLQNIMLSNEYIRSNIEVNDWNVIYKRIRIRYKNVAEINGNISKDLLNTLSNYIKFGPLHGFSIELLREQFSFVSQLCDSVKIDSPRPIKIAIVEIIYYFSLHTARDSRSSCCKLGEDTFHSLFGLYEIQNPRNDGMKLMLVKYLLLQFVLHHPKGVIAANSGAFAFSWEKWNQCINSIYRKCQEDIVHCTKLKTHCGNTMPICIEKSIKYLQKDFARLFAESIRHIEFNQREEQQSAVEEKKAKRIKIESPLEDLISSIERSQQWPWLNVMSTLLKIQPDILNASQFSSLLQVLSRLQVECKDDSLAHHIYHCLSILETIQCSLGLYKSDNIRNTWNIVRDTTMRTFGLNQNDPSLHALLQKFIIGAYNISSENVLQTYISKVLDVTEHNLMTLATTFDRTSFSITKSQKELLIKWILRKNNTEDFQYLSHSITARILVGLVVNKWPTSVEEYVNQLEYDEPFEEIADVYLQLEFEKSFIINTRKNKSIQYKQRRVTLQDDLCIFLNNSIKTLIESIDESQNNEKKINPILNIIVLLKNVLEHLMKFDLLQENDLNENSLLEIIVLLLDKVNDILFPYLSYENFDDVTISILNRGMNCLNEFFISSSNVYLEEKIRKIMPIDLLKTLFSFLREHDKEKKLDFKELRLPLLNLRKVIVKVLVSYCSGLKNFTSYQKFMFDALITFDYNIDEYSNCELPFMLLKCIKESEIKNLSDEEITALFQLFCDLCTNRYKYYSCSKDIMEFLYYFSTNVATNGSIQSKEQMMEILFPFYVERKRYGPEYNVILLNCIEKLYEVDVHHDFAKWNNNEVILKLPEFLCDVYLEVRFAAIQNITKFFEVSSSRNTVQDFHLQEIIFHNICDKTEKIFEVEGNLIERKLDETVTRSVSALHVLSSVMLVSHRWRENALFALFKIIHKRRLDSFPKVFRMIFKHLNLERESFLEKYSYTILRRWLNEELEMDSFLFSLFGCEDSTSFYLKYLKEIIPYLIENQKDLNDLDCIGKSLHSIFEECFSDLCARGLLSNIGKSPKSDLRNNIILSRLEEHFGTQEFLSNFTEKVDEILLNLLATVRDSENISQNFNMSMVFLKSSDKYITTEEFYQVINSIEKKICLQEPLVYYLFKEKINKLQDIMMKLHIRIHDSIASDEKIVCFHQYTVMNDLTMEYFDRSDSREYFIREISYLLIRIIGNNFEFPELRLCAVTYFKNCFNKLIIFPEIIRKYFIAITTTFINIIIEEKNNDLTCSSLDVLKYLMNLKIFEEDIKCMDNLPEHHLLKDLLEIQSELKKTNNTISLVKEIQNVVDNGYMNKDCSFKVDSLKNLKLYLFSLKNQLKSLYKDLSKLNGFSEDCENSLIHQLVSLLVELCLSKEKNVSMEALKCLGELGPSDLLTLIVKPEKQSSFDISTPQEYFTGRVISLLNLYLTDNNTQLIFPSVKVLYSVLNTSEGRKAIESGNDYGYGALPKEYFKPFLVEKKPKSFSLGFKKSMEKLVSRINSDILWCPERAVEYEDWIKNLLCNIIETIPDCYIPWLTPICKMKTEFCEIILPSLIYLLVSLNDEINVIITRKINEFFEKHWNMVMSPNKSNHIALNKNAVKVMLSVVHFVRINRSNMRLKMKVDDPDLDYLKIAKAAQYCSAYFTSLLYTEIWCYSKVETVKSVTFTSSVLDLIHENSDEDTSLAVLHILRSSYEAIGDEDSLQGCGLSFLLNPIHRIEHFKDVGMWDQAILYENLQVYSNQPKSKDMLIESLKRRGLFETSLMCNDARLEPDYECMWRLSNWTHPEIKKSADIKMSFKKEMEMYKYHILKAVHERDVFSVMEHIENARLSIVDKLRHTSFESSSNLYGILVHLQSFNEVEEILNAYSDTDDLNTVIKKWFLQDKIDKKFIYLEPVITQRMVVLNDFLKGSDDVAFYKRHLIDLALNLSEKSRVENMNHFGVRALNFVRNLPELTQNEENKIYLEDAQLCWESNNKITAKRILNKISENQRIEPRLRSEALKLMGKWSAESYSEHANTIINDYLEPSLILMKGLESSKNDSKSIYETYDILSRFADRQYQQVTAHMSSDIFQKKMENLKKSSETLKNLRKPVTTDEKVAQIFHERQSKIDKTEIENTKREKEYFLQIALKYYMKILTYSDSSHLQIFRVMALFLENRSSTSITEIVEKYIQKIPTYKFLTILPQLIPHIANRNNADLFSMKANEIIDKCAREHPHHTIPIILALANSLKDSEYSKVKTKISINEERVSEAKKIIKSLKDEPTLKEIINGIEFVSDALIQLAYLDSKESKHKIDISKRSKIAAIKDFDNVSVFTHNLKIQKKGSYGNIVGIYCYDKQYRLVGGKNAPKKINCIGTDGKSYEQLVKGQDDLRQDAVMQQVFTILNSLLSGDKNSYGLKIRTYKIVPLSMRSGVLEWAKDTMPVGAYLTGDGEIEGAHQRYRPNDKRPSVCRAEIAEAAKGSADVKLRVFNKICKEFKPVFHHFFEENFLQPTVWYERRMAYIHSVATTSMVGYILGIGDRHVSNILIDKITAELVHIDFGIAFEQGRTLPTPETVPFRLTRDFVDAMGISGVEGAFKKSCEKTMTVMKDNYQTIMAILEVLLYDPLYSWTVSVAEANKRQRVSLDDSTTSYKGSPQSSEGDTSVNITAQRALMRLKAKLLGTEEGTPMSVEHQVAALVHQAMDPANLSKLYCGWQAYL